MEHLDYNNETVPELNWFQRVKAYFKRLVQRTETEPETDEEDAYNQNYERIGVWHFTEVKLQNKQGIMNEITEDGKALHKIGFQDGSLGVHTSSMKNITERIATLWQSFIESQFRQKLAEAEVRCSDAQLNYDHQVQTYESLNKYKRVSDTHYNLHPKEYSFGMGMTYLLIALVLVIADFPLSRQMVTEGFIIDDGSESTILAVGLALMTVYIKIMYDQYFGNSLQNNMLNRRSENILGEGNLATEKELKHSRRIKATQLAVKLVVLFALLATIVVLGRFRFEFLKIKPTTEISPEVKNIISNSGKAEWSFILITLILPLIGGVCASIGLSKIRNVKQRRRIERRLRKGLVKKEKALNVLMEAKGHMTACSNHLAWASKDGDFIHNYANYFFECYLHGYDRGMQESISENLFEAAVGMRKKMVGRRSYDLQR